MKELVHIETGKKDANFGDESGLYNFYTCAMSPIKSKTYSYDGDYLILPGNGANVGMSIHYIGKFEAYQRTYLLSKKSLDINFLYIQIVLDAYWKEYNKDKQYGSAIPYIKLGNLENFLVPLPPVQEQEHIVSMFENFEPLLTEYDKLEQKKTKLDDEIYDKLKKSILQYAIQGKLVEQDANDEPASILLEQIRTEKKALLGKKYVESYIYKNDDNCYYEKIGETITNINDIIPFELPENWSWCRLKNIINSITDGTHSTPKYTSTGVPFISVKDISSGKISFANTKYISLEEHELLSKRCCPQFGDLLLTKVGTTGIPVLVNTEEKFSLFVSVALIKFNKQFINPDFFVYLLQSPLVQTQAAENTKGVGNKNWVLSDIEKTLVVIPPIKEQNKIVKKLNEAFSNIKDEG